MASRCINALNELDAVSDKVFYKYSKNRLKEDIARKVRESKSRTERSASSTSRVEKCTSRKSNQSNRSSLHSTTTAKNSSKVSKTSATKSTSNVNTSKSNSHQGNTRPKYTKIASRTSSENNNINEVNSVSEKRNKTPSIFGKYTPGAPKYKPGKWFNFDDGVNQGVIDSFACDDLKEKALCYKVDVKESTSVPKLLRHRLQVRIGQNGEVKNDDAGGLTQDNQSAESVSNEDVRIAPLSWEEQLNWENTRIMTPRIPKPQKSTTEGLSETHPVIFNPEANYPRLSTTTTISNEATVSYRLYMDKKLVSDRRNLTCERKCVTSIELEESSESSPFRGKSDKGPILRTKSQDSDLMDMTSTIQNIGKIYRTYSEESTRKSKAPLEEETQDVKTVEENPDKNQQSLENEKLQELEKVNKINKKVSFKDDIEASNILKNKETQGENPENMLRSNLKRTAQRPSSSKARFVLIENEGPKVDKPRRPLTAPPCSPRNLKETKIEEKTIVPTKQLLPIWVPTSNEVQSENENDLKEERSEPTPELQDICVKVTCKSAPIVRSTQPEDTLSRSQSTTSTRVKTEKYTPPQPIVVLDDSDPFELPSNVPPGQALLELRQKIRENLAKETADLQLDIQQLYLKHHSNYINN